MYKIRVILDVEEDVVRTLLVAQSINLESLHYTIAQSFGFDSSEMASFYRADHDWSQGEEIPLLNMSETGEGISMQNSFLRKSLPHIGDKLIYLYDFLNMWTFYVEVIDILEEVDLEPKIIFSIGEVPNENPEREFTAENYRNPLDNEFSDTFGIEFEGLDDIDFETY